MVHWLLVIDDLEFTNLGLLGLKAVPFDKLRANMAGLAGYFFIASSPFD